MLAADDEDCVRGARLHVHARPPELYLLAEDGEGGEVEADGLDDGRLVQLPQLDHRVLAVGEHQPLVNVQLDVNDASLNILFIKTSSRISIEVYLQV